MKLPLPKDFFQCPPLSDKDKACLREIARQAALDIVHLTQHPDAVQWQPVRQSSRHVRVFRGMDPNTPPSVATWCGITNLHATIDEVADLFRAETTEQYQEYCRMFSKELMDGATLYTLAQPTPEFPRHFIGVKWNAFETPFLVNNRDFLNLEAQFDVEFEGRRGWVRVFRSVQLTCCPEFSGLLGLIRAAQYCTGHVFFESDKPGYLQHTHLIQCDLRGNVPAFAVAIGMKKRFRQMLDFRRYLCERRLAQTEFVNVSQFTPKDEWDQCHLCRRSFGILRRRAKEHCRKCGEVVCLDCVKSWEIPINHKFVSLPICTRCTHQVIQADSDSDLSSMGNSSARPIVMGGAMLFAPPSPEVYDKSGPHRFLVCDCEKESRTIPSLGDEEPFLCGDDVFLDDVDIILGTVKDVS
ncbi:hypothetical protein LEN26_019260 [Aphanomyces euteiches]|nr:hypothetical protein LEN26_019260 [Aphanomyces euteiches]KAH9110992.1 hypothetical protein AeMF1_014353 [Aphanomyces euteiches]KAH9197522.1 hypothetical protein AeNC1_000472 [Aphanomyces euteiches]